MQAEGSQQANSAVVVFLVVPSEKAAARLAPTGSQRRFKYNEADKFAFFGGQAANRQSDLTETRDVNGLLVGSAIRWANADPPDLSSRVTSLHVRNSRASSLRFSL